MSASYHEGRSAEAGTLSTPPPRAVLIDVGFTLTFWDGARIASHAALEGVVADPRAIERAEATIRGETREVPGAPMRTHDDGGRAYLRGVFRRILEVAETPGDAAAIERAAAAIFREHLRRNVWRRVGAGNREALERLRAAGIALGVVSNSEGTIDAMLTDVGLRPFFAAVVDSAVEGVVKPDAAIFNLALERLGVAAADTIMVGDSPTADVHGAQAAGLRAALLDPFDLYPWIQAPRFKDLPAFTNAVLRSDS
jgi:HAD superfamily hydrolase (TIGR01509 family)